MPARTAAVPAEVPGRAAALALARVLTVALWALAVAVGGPPSFTHLGLRAGVAALGFALAFAARAAWDERTRPLRAGWWILLAVGAVAAFVDPLLAVAAAALAVGLAVASDAPSAPGTLVVAATVAILWRDPGAWGQDETLEAALVATGMLLALGAAAAERERQSRAAATPVAAAWIVLVLLAVAAWTAALLGLRHALRGVDLMPFLASGTTAGRILLATLLLVLVAGAALLLRQRRPAA